MCLMAPGLVTTVGVDTAQVSVDGVTRTAITLLTPDVRPGDWVLVGAGAIVRRLDPAQAASMRRAIDVASGSPVTTPHTTINEAQGGTP